MNSNKHSKHVLYQQKCIRNNFESPDPSLQLHCLPLRPRHPHPALRNHIPSSTMPSHPCLDVHPSPLNQLTTIVHTILGKKANRSSSLSQVVNYFDSSPSLSDNSMSLLDSPLRRSDQQTPKAHTSFYNPRGASDSESSSDEEDEDLRDQSPELAETDNRGLRSRSRSLKGYIHTKRWPDRFKGSHSSGSSGMGTGGSNSTTSLTGQQESIGGGRQSSPEYVPAGTTVRGSMSDIGSEDLLMTKLSVSRNENYGDRTLSPFVCSSSWTAVDL